MGADAMRRHVHGGEGQGTGVPPTRTMSAHTKVSVSDAPRVQVGHGGARTAQVESGGGEVEGPMRSDEVHQVALRQQLQKQIHVSVVFC